jgi:hypothetical protein
MAALSETRYHIALLPRLAFYRFALALIQGDKPQYELGLGRMDLRAGGELAPVYLADFARRARESGFNTAVLAGVRPTLGYRACMPRHLLACLLMVTTLVAACQPKPAATSSAVTPKRPSTAPEPRPKASLTTAAAPKALLVAAADSVELSGVVSMDGRYLERIGAGKREGAAIVLSGNAVGDGNAIAPASVISNNSGSVISSGGGSVISSGGGSVISSGGGRYRLQADAGEVQLPAAGLALYVRSLKTGEPISLGEDADGKPVQAIYSNAQGGYKVFLPRSVQEDNVEIVTLVPGISSDRTRLEVVTSAGSGTAKVDENASNASMLIRLAFVSFARAVIRGDEAVVAAGIGQGDVLINPEAPLRILRNYMSRAKASGLAMATAEQQDRAANRFVDIVLASTVM